MLPRKNEERMAYVNSTHRMEWLCKLFCNVAADFANENILDKQLDKLKSAELEINWDQALPWLRQGVDLNQGSPNFSM